MWCFWWTRNIKSAFFRSPKNKRISFFEAVEAATEELGSELARVAHQLDIVKNNLSAMNRLINKDVISSARPPFTHVHRLQIQTNHFLPTRVFQIGLTMFFMREIWNNVILFSCKMMQNMFAVPFPQCYK